MPTHKSAAKRMKTAERDRQRNRRIKTNLRSSVKDFREKKQSDKSQSEYKEVVSLIDSAVRKGIIHKNKAARTKSRLSRLIKK